MMNSKTIPKGLIIGAAALLGLGAGILLIQGGLPAGDAQVAPVESIANGTRSLRVEGHRSVSSIRRDPDRAARGIAEVAAELRFE